MDTVGKACCYGYSIITSSILSMQLPMLNSLPAVVWLMSFLAPLVVVLLVLFAEDGGDDNGDEVRVMMQACRSLYSIRSITILTDEHINN